YSGALVCGLGAARDEPTVPDLMALMDEGDRLQSQCDRGWTYTRLLQRLGEEVVAQRCTLDEATTQIAASEKGRDPAWREQLHAVYPGASDREGLATNLVIQVPAAPRQDGPEGQRLSRWMVEQFEMTFGTSLPLDDVTLRLYTQPDARIQAELASTPTPKGRGEDTDPYGVTE